MAAADNLTSNWLPELGGSELRRVKESLYANDFEWSQKGRIAIRMPPQRIYVELWPETSPLAVENFVALVLGNRGKGQESGCALSYTNCHFHRIIKGFVAQGGVRPIERLELSPRVHGLALRRYARAVGRILSRTMAAAASASSRARRPASRTTRQGSR